MDIIKTNWNWAYGLGYRSSTKYLVLHHAAASVASPADVHRWHLNAGWSGIGYHFYVRKNGAVYAGRPLGAIGAHARGYNAVSVGICAEGNFEKETMPPAQQKALTELVSYVQKKYRNKLVVVGHGDLMPTACPGRLYPFKEIKGGVVADRLLKAGQYPLLKDKMLGYVLRELGGENPVSMKGATGFRVLPETWGEPARSLAWRISGRLGGVQQTAQPTVELHEALKRR